MKLLIHELFKEPIPLDERLSCLVIENQNLFFRMVKELNDQVMNKANTSEAFVILKNEEKLDISKSIILFTDILNFEINNRKIKTELLKKIANDEKKLSTVSKINTINEQIQQYFEELFERYFINVHYVEEVELLDFLKLYKVEVINEEETLLETLFNWIKAFIELANITNFAFINLSTFLTRNEIEELDQFCQYEKVSVVMFENNFSNLENIKNINIIDGDLCHIITSNMV